MMAGNAIDAELAWVLIKMAREQRYRYVGLKGKDDILLKFNVPDQVQQELMHIDRELAGKLISDDENPLTAHQKERFIISALREEAIASSMLEGAATTRRDAKKMLQLGRKPRTRGERMVLNNYNAIQFVRENRNVDLSTDFLKELQKILTEGTLDNADEAGRFRTEKDDITIIDQRDNQVLHVPPPASELEERMGSLCRFANGKTAKGRFMHPVIQACIVHFQLGFDHPFCDGNGRTARALFYWLMLRKGYWLFEYIPISRMIYEGPAKYVRAFLYCESDEFDVTYFLVYKAKITARARQQLHDYIDRKQRRLTEARRQFSADNRLNPRQQELVLQVARNPDISFTVASHQGRNAIAYGTARNDLIQLAQWGYLVQETVGRQMHFRPAEEFAKSCRA